MSRKLEPAQAEMIKVFREFGFTKAALGREYGVHVDTIRNIDKGVSFNGGAPKRKDRKLSDDDIRFIRAKGASGIKEQQISNLLRTERNIEVSRSTVRQVLNGKSYKDVQ